MAADNDDLLLLLNYIDTLSPAGRVFRQHSNPLQEYDEMKFRQRFSWTPLCPMNERKQ